MKTVFINGLMPLRSRFFIRALCREFIVVGPGFGALADDPEIKIIEPSDVIGEKLETDSIENLQWDDVAEVVGRLNCMVSFPLNKARFLNRENLN